MSHIVFCDDQECGRLLIQPVNYSGAAFPTHIRQILKVKHQGMNDGPIADSGPGMDHESGRLFNDCQVPVFEIDLERDLLRCDLYRVKGVEVDLDGFPAPNPVAGLSPAAINKNGAGTVERLDL